MTSAAAGAAAGAGAGAFAGPLGAIGGALIGGVGSWLSGNSSRDFAEQSYKHRYQWMVKDLQKAGLNPMLAVGQSPGNVPQPDFQNVGEGALKGSSAAAAVRLIQAQVAQASAQTDAARATGNKTMAEAQAQEMNNLILQASPLYQSAKSTLGEFGEVRGTSAAAQDRWDADLAKTRAEATKIAQDTELTKLAAEYQRGELDIQQTRVKYADALARLEVAYKAAMTAAQANQVPASAADAAFWKEAGALGKLAVFLRSVMPK